MSDEKDIKAPDASKRSSSIERAIASKGSSAQDSKKAPAAAAAPPSKAPDAAATPAAAASSKAATTAAGSDSDKWAKPDGVAGGSNDPVAKGPTASKPDTDVKDSKNPPAPKGAADTKKPTSEALQTTKKEASKEASKEPPKEPPKETAQANPPKPAKQKSGRGLAFLSLLLALGAAGGAGYLYYELIHLKPFEQQLAGQMDTVQQAVSSATAQANDDSRELAQQFAGLEERFAALRGEQSSAIDGALTQQQQRLETTEKSLMESLNKVANQAPPSQEEWKLAELEYLLRIANHRVLMEKDADGARRLLETADAIVAELDDFGLHDVRVQLADEILSLKRLGKNDVQGLFLRLEAVKRGLDGLPLRVPEYLTKPPTGAEGETGETRGPLAAFAESMGTFLKFRQLETKIKPLLAPDEISYLELNLRLMLEQAQLGALRGQPDVFEQSLDNAMDWLTRYLDADSEAVTDMVGELAALREISVARELPDISGSLRALLATERAPS